MITHLFRSLRHRHFRIYYFAQLVSITGTWMQNVAQAWLMYRLTDSAMMLGLVGFAGLVPILLLGLPAGVLADRVSRRSLLVGAQWVAMVQALIFATLVLTDWIAPWQIIVLAFVLGVTHALELPSRHSFVAELVPRADLPNAIALNASVFNTARFAGPAIAGWLVALAGEGVVFLLNAGTFLAVLVALTMIPAAAVDTGMAGKRRGMMDGLRFARDHHAIRPALALLATTSLGGTAYTVLMPIFSREVFGGGAETLGMLLGSAGAGALAAAGRLAWLGGRQSLERNIATAAVAAGGSMLLFAATDALWLAMVLLVIQGFALTTMVASINTLVQVQVPDHYRGRVMALFSVLFIGLTSIGNLLAGTAASWLGAPRTVLIFGIVVIAAGSAYGRWVGTRGEGGAV